MATIDGSSASADVRTPEQQLAWEAENRLKATIAAVLAGVLTLAGGIVSATAFSGFPQVGLIQALSPALSGQRAPAVDPHRPAIVFLDGRAGQFVASAVLAAIGTLATGYVLYYLFEAIRARRPEAPPWAKWTALIAPAAVALLSVARQVASVVSTHDYVTHPDGTRHALDAVNSGAAVPLGYLGLVAQLVLVATLVVIALNAMRVGLLTRFMGVLGIIAGVLFILPVFGTLPLIQALWLIALAPIFLHRWPAGQPPAWSTGRAEPWPSQQQVREQRQAQRNRAEAQVIRDAPAASDRMAVDDDGAEPAAPVRPRQNRRKRRKR